MNCAKAHGAERDPPPGRAQSRANMLALCHVTGLAGIVAALGLAAFSVAG
jgi:hypothetical protein